VKRHTVGKGKRLKGIYRSRASGQKAYVRYVQDNDHVYFTLEPQGSSGNMPVASFERQYERDK